MFTDPTRARRWQQLSQRPFRLFAHRLTPSLIGRAADQAGCDRGGGPLNLLNLTWLALACAYHRSRSFADVLGLTVKLLSDLSAGPEPVPPPPRPRPRRHDPRVEDPDRLSPQAFAQARARLPWAFWLALIGLLADDFEQQHRPLLLWQGRYRLLCLDGSTVNLPTAGALARHFGSAGNGTGTRRPQARLVLLQLTRARLPWRFDLTPLAQSEVEVAKGLLRQVRGNDLVLMDRGFCCYELFGLIARRDAFFVSRLRQQVKLTAVRQLGPHDRLVQWRPASGAAKKAIRAEQLPAGMELRVIGYQVEGFRPSAVVTNLLDAQALPAEEFVRLAVAEQGRRLVAAGLYHSRWEIELTFAELKGVQGLERCLRSRTPAGIRYEVAGQLLLYQLLRWLLVEAAQQAGVEDPLRLSYQEALEEWDDLQPTLLRSSPRRIRGVWRPRLLHRLARHAIPFRPNRHAPRRHDGKPKNKGHGRFQEASRVATAPTPQPPDGAGDPKRRGDNPNQG
jgi:hypothetical protein